MNPTVGYVIEEIAAQKEISARNALFGEAFENEALLSHTLGGKMASLDEFKSFREKMNKKNSEAAAWRRSVSSRSTEPSQRRCLTAEQKES